MPYTFVALIPAGATGGPRRYLSPTLISCDLWTTRPFYVYYRDRLHRFRSLTKINYRAIRILIRESVTHATQRPSIFRPEFRNSGAATVKSHRARACVRSRTWKETLSQRMITKSANSLFFSVGRCTLDDDDSSSILHFARAIIIKRNLNLPRSRDLARTSFVRIICDTHHANFRLLFNLASSLCENSGLLHSQMTHGQTDRALPEEYFRDRSGNHDAIRTIRVRG